MAEGHFLIYGVGGLGLGQCIVGLGLRVGLGFGQCVVGSTLCKAGGLGEQGAHLEGGVVGGGVLVDDDAVGAYYLAPVGQQVVHL